ncbi:MAG: hypothetical protein KC550_07485, partial [Nanoarchaeota archaeon]|nr:hypothetical protein [Nanoarchaeota archaeon]
MKDSNDKFETFLFYITAFKYNKKFIQKLDLFEYENKPSFHSNYKELRNLFKNSKEKIWKEFGLFFKVDKKEHNENLDKVNLIQNKIRGRFGHTDSVREAYFEIESLLTEAEKNLFSNNRTSFISSFILVSENILEALILSNYIKKDIITKYFRNSKKSLNSYTYKQKIKIMEEHLENTELKYQYKPFL